METAKTELRQTAILDTKQLLEYIKQPIEF